MAPLLFVTLPLANAGTPLIWATMFHLAFGNILLGIFEGWLLAKVFQLQKTRTIGLLVLANYASAFLGGALIGKIVAIPEVTIANLRSAFVLFVLAAFAITLCIEFFFIWAAVKRLGRAVKGTLGVHLVSYPLLFGAYWLVSGTSMMTALKVVPAEELAGEMTRYAVYYISPAGDQVLRRKMGKDERPELVANITRSPHYKRLIARKTEEGKFDLLLYLRNKRAAEEQLIKPAFAENAGLEEWMVKANQPNQTDNMGASTRLTTSSDWEFRTGFWPIEGLSGRNSKTGKRIRFANETPFFQWAARYSTHLEGDRLLFQLGDDQICIIHPASRRIALFARGSGPVVAIPF